MGSPDDVNDGVIILDSSLRSIGVDRGAETIFGILGENGVNGDHVPREILDLLRARPNQDGNGAPMFVNVLGRSYSCRPFVVRRHNGDEPFLAVYLRREISIADAAHQIAVEYRLSEREEEVLIGLSMGLSGKEVASRMNISPNTVKAFVRLAMIKMGANNRARLFAKLFDRQSQ